MMPGKCTDALNLIYGVEKCPKSQKCPKVPEVLKSAGPENYNFPKKTKKGGVFLHIFYSSVESYKRVLISDHKSSVWEVAIIWYLSFFFKF